MLKTKAGPSRKTEHMLLETQLSRMALTLLSALGASVLSVAYLPVSAVPASSAREIPLWTAVGITAGLVGFLWLLARAICARLLSPLRDLDAEIDRIVSGDLEEPPGNRSTRCSGSGNGCPIRDCAAPEDASKPCWAIDTESIRSRVFEPRFPPQLDRCRSCAVFLAGNNDHLARTARNVDLIRHVLHSSWQWIRQSRSLRVNLIRNSFDGIIASNPDDVVTIFNHQAHSILGYDETEVVGIRKWQDLLPPRLSRDLYSPLDRDSTAGLFGFFRKEFTITTKRGNSIPVRASGVRLREGETDLGKVFFLQDMREIDRLRAGLIQAERLAATGQAVASISHSIRNILGAVNGGLHIFRLGRTEKSEADIECGWEMVERNTAIISELVKDLLNFAKERKLEFEECDPVGFLGHVASAMKPKAKERNVKIIVDADRAVETILIDPYALNQCLGNLLSNAIDAIPPADPGEVRLSLSKNHGQIIFTVTDNGSGMSPAIRKKIMKGMFSTKGSKGTGLGLVVAQKIVNEHKGQLHVESRENEGSTFTVCLPLNPKATDDCQQPLFERLKGGL